MLQLDHICKSYTTGSFTQKALDDVSISFRDNEFVAILGPSGSGKTTMLNVIGGLDHYDSGDLIIDGVSTKRYKDRDWDTYRNNRVGFVFQSYNLIPHQTVLANVELALTLSGVAPDERRDRAIRALKRVGLGDHIDKKPAQMSGGQMQRVAIARALINDPDILLADEPTGALDSKTSVQIMDLLTEIADDRLVVMVTHNPELAEEYATRIVNLADGVIRSDTNPYNPTADEVAAATAKPIRRTRMSFLTALSLSANNLLTKKGRTIMTAIAGSIGIIGIAAILALANGVNNYIKTVEEETLSVYPLQILSTGFDMTSMMAGMAGSQDEGDDGGEGEASGSAAAPDPQAMVEAMTTEPEEGTIAEGKVMTRMFASIGNNDLASLKEYFDSGQSGIEQYTNCIYYEYDVTPQIFDPDTSDGVHQINPDTTFTSLGFGSGASTNSIMSMSMSTNVFSELPKDNDIITNQYNVVAGKWPEKADELVLVLTQSGRMSDFLSYVLGLRDRDKLDKMVKQFVNEEEVKVEEEDITIRFEDIVGKKLKLLYATDFYRYDDEYEVWVDKSDDKKYMKSAVRQGEDLTIVGIVRPAPDANATALTSGVYYTQDLTAQLINHAAESEIVKKQMADRKRDVFSGKTFDEMEEEEGDGFDMTSLFTIDEEALSASFSFDTEALSLDGLDFSSMDLSGIDMSSLDLSNLDISDVEAPDVDFDSLMGAVANEVDPDELAKLFPEFTPEQLSKALSGVEVNFADGGKAMNNAISVVGQDFAAWRAKNPKAEIADYLSSSSVVAEQTQAVIASLDMQGLSEQVVAAIAKELDTTPAGIPEKVGGRLMDAYAERIGAVVQDQIGEQLGDYITQIMGKYMANIGQLLGERITEGMTNVFNQLSDVFGGAMGFDADKFAEAFNFNMDEEELTELMTSMMRVEEHSYDNNLKKLGYADFAKPFEISIYPKDFDSKEQVIRVLDEYNDRMKAEDEDKVISYTDIVGTLMESVTDIVNMISYVLIAFVAISLVVSSIMIGVITYISVLERKKEIGILRAIGASKSDISHVFNAETVIEGLVSGLLGVGVTALVCIPVNIYVYHVFDVPNVALLPPVAAVVLVLISVVLTYVAGVIPSRSASRKDPVEALRSE